MILLSSIYSNPRIPSGYYYARLIDLRVEEMPGASHPRVWAQLQIGPMYPKGVGGAVLSSVIHETEKARFYFENFCNSFFITEGKDPYSALFKWACIEVMDAQYKEAKYSTIKYIYQRRDARLMAVKLKQAEQNGELKWPGQTLYDKPSEPTPTPQPDRPPENIDLFADE